MNAWIIYTSQEVLIFLLTLKTASNKLEGKCSFADYVKPSLDTQAVGKGQESSWLQGLSL